MSVYDKIQGAFLKRLHYHQCGESMAHQLTINKRQIIIKHRGLYILNKTYIIFHIDFWWMEFIMIRSATGRMN